MEEHKDDAPETAGASQIAKDSETAGATRTGRVLRVIGTLKAVRALKAARASKTGKIPEATKAPEAAQGGGLNPLSPDTEKQLSELDKLARRLENSGVAEYVKLQKKTGKILFLNFLSGVARGLGFTVGTTIVLTVLYQIISRIISMNIPYLTEKLQEFLELTRGGH